MSNIDFEKWGILLDIADKKKQDFDELFLERRAYKATHRQTNGQPPIANGYVNWLHFPARPKDNRRKTGFILK